MSTFIALSLYHIPDSKALKPQSKKEKSQNPNA